MKLNSIQYLRALAALGVAAAHASTALGDRGLVRLDLGGAGVDLFFVISGFIMFFTTDGRGRSPGEFYKRRIVRIFPLYFILSTVAFVLASIAPAAFNTFGNDVWNYIRSIFFIPFYNLKVREIRPEIGVGWTLNYEAFFYLVFGALLPVGRVLRVICCVLVFAVLSIAGAIFRPAGPILYTYTDSIMIEFVFGVLLGYLMAPGTGPRLRAGGLILLGVAVCASLGVQGLAPQIALPRFLASGVPAAAAVAACLWLERMEKAPNWPAVVLIGDASYSLYLSHGFVLGLLQRIWTRLFDVNQVTTQVAFIATAVVCATAAAIALYRIVEKPVTIFLSSNIDGGKLPAVLRRAA